MRQYYLQALFYFAIRHFSFQLAFIATTAENQVRKTIGCVTGWKSQFRPYAGPGPWMLHGWRSATGVNLKTQTLEASLPLAWLWLEYLPAYASVFPLVWEHPSSASADRLRYLWPAVPDGQFSLGSPLFLGVMIALSFHFPKVVSITTKQWFTCGMKCISLLIKGFFIDSNLIWTFFVPNTHLQFVSPSTTLK